MASLDEARRAWRQTLSNYQEKLPTRTAVMGDGRGFATSNIVVPGRPDYVFARDTVESPTYYQILNRGAVPPAVGMPITIGYSLFDGTEEEQVIGVNYSGLGQNFAANSPQIGPHHQQHEFQGGDQVNVDSRQFMVGLVHPTDPASMAVKVESFIYFWNSWRRFDAVTTQLFNEYIPGSGYIAYLLITLDPESNSLRYHVGAPISTGSADALLGTFSAIPAPPPIEIPLGYVRLTNGMTNLGWSQTDNNVGEARLFLNTSLQWLVDKIRQLEGYSGNDSALPACGASAYPTG